MELRHLRYFIAVADELSFRRAAARLHIAAPPLSVQINKLEIEIGVELFEREGRGIRLTDAGRTFLVHARKTLAEADRAIIAARQSASGEIGELAIGHNMPAGFRVFPEVVPDFKRKWPQVRLTFHHLNVGQQLERLRHSTLDIGVVWLPGPLDDLDVHELLVEPVIAVLHKDHPLANAPSVSVRDLCREPLILLSRRMDPETFRDIQNMFTREKAAMNIAYELENSVAMINFVAMGAGISLLPAYTRSIRQDGVVYRDLAPPGMSKTLAMIKRTGAGGLAEAFCAFTVERLALSRQAITPRAPARRNSAK
jgi:DNA-binding transcriptional LysR family regulator